MSISEQLDKASAQLKGLSEKASEAEANANAAKSTARLSGKYAVWLPQRLLNARIGMNSTRCSAMSI